MQREHQKKASCKVVRPGEPVPGKQALIYESGISAETVGATGIHMQLATLPPLARAKAHMHDTHETAIYVLSGHSCVWFGENLDQHAEVNAGEFFYIPAGMPHLPYNPSDTESCLTVIARTDPNEQESVVLLPHLQPPGTKNA
ncbi:cupin domain-containing protein [Paraburkholderia sp. NMBU_R16]|uniref:cupin domain-containing protein n=1 Tax=Paraburkholderia sp. NMBU_R16 TaxID=2698676 RepID=UPI0015639BC3|nr:cupin domain-containing protein [Paraburkholderia sp. NMBU_R16]NRO98983.1 cupin domain-containing protein [Paraburkholderia sp. NMBU_R16]